MRTINRPPHLLTLHSGEATREIGYGTDARGDVRRMEESAWDGPIDGPISRAVLEVKTNAGGTARLQIPGRQYRMLEESEAIEGLVAALARGKQPAAALDVALLAAAL